MLEVKSCDCFSLRTGTIIIGVLQIILSVIIVILTYALGIRWEELLTDVDPDTAKLIYTISFCITIFIAILLLVGVFKRNTCMMLPWLVLGVITSLSGVIHTICMVIVLFMNNNVRGCIAAFVTGLLSFMIYFNFWRIVYSHFKQLKNEKMNNYQQQA